MAKCVYCCKQQVSGNKVSHSNIKTRTKNNPNVQRLKAVLGGKTQRIWVCTRCIRSGKVTRPTPRSAQKRTGEASA
ncbi:MAG: 50S ribosomal protein L28 [Oligoflexia bacterium]|nr:50S ribosomal protein L28 [Oligoflexia bacterium]